MFCLAFLEGNLARWEIWEEHYKLDNLTKKYKLICANTYHAYVLVLIIYVMSILDKKTYKIASYNEGLEN